MLLDLPEMPSDMTDEDVLGVVEAVWTNPQGYIERFLVIRTKDMEHVRFKMNRTQSDLLDVIKDMWARGVPVRIMVLKARQEGVSTFVQGLFFTLVATNAQMTMWVIAHDRESSGNLFGMSERFLDNLDSRLKPMVRNRDKKRIRFDNPDAALRGRNPVLIEGLVVRGLGRLEADSHVLMNSGPNPIAADPELAMLDVEAIEAGISTSTVPDDDMGFIIDNHSLNQDNDEVFDPKINDTLIVNKNIKSQLLKRHPDIDPDNIIGAYFGRKELNPVNGLVEHSRELRGEVYGYAWLYESDKKMPGEEWGYFCWDAFEYLRDRGVKHIVIANPQVCTASVLDMVEMPNQIAREIGFKSWALWAKKDYTKYPEVGHPFADYWGVWAYTDCGEWNLNYVNGTNGFTMGATLTGQTSAATALIKWLSGDAASLFQHHALFSA